MLLLRWVALLAVLCISIAVVSGVAAALPDGGQLAVVAGGQIYWVDVLSGRAMLLTPQGREFSLAYGPIQWSPDGSKLGFQVASITHSGVGFIDFPTLQRTRVAGTFEENARDFAWSPDSRMIAFIRENRAQAISEIWVLSLDTYSPTLLSDEAGYRLVWSPDGSMVGYILLSGDSFRLISVNTRDIQTVDIDHASEWSNPNLRLIQANLWDPQVASEMSGGVSLSSDGRRIASICNSDYQRLSASICVMGVDGTGLREIIRFPAWNMPDEVAWRP
ncbi:MAG: hypothetical protein SF123_03180 [Chloroflexota bacterium]|nr:hypothetical protein [Chloroflexota bacterium]